MPVRVEDIAIAVAPIGSETTAQAALGLFLSDPSLFALPVVVNGATDGAVMPSHLASLGFYLLRARTQLREIVNILQK